MHLIPTKFHSTFYLWSLVLFAVFIHWSHTLTVVITFIIGLLWLLQPNFKESLLVFIKKPSFYLFSSIFFITLLSLPFTKHWEEALDYLILILPIFLLPLFIGSSKRLTPSELQLLMFCYIGSTVFSSVFNLVYFSYNYSSITDIRSISFFMSHIRYSLFILIAIAGCYYYLTSSIKNIFINICLFITMIWLITFLFILQSATGVIIFILLTFLITIIKILKSKSLILRMTLFSFLIIMISILLWGVIRIIYEFSSVPKENFSKLDSITQYGNHYQNDLTNKMVENGNYVYLYICEAELQNTWNIVSKIPYNGKDRKGQNINQTLVRYLTSKGLRKDRNGVLALSFADVKNIENGIANYKMANRFSITNRLYQIVWEIDLYIKGAGRANPSGHSITQRFEFWRCATAIISDNFFAGVGVGNVKSSLNQYYISTRSHLNPDRFFYPHNQYLTLMVRYGFFGLILFFISIIGAILYEKKQHDFFVIIYLFILLLSMINEDTLETQYGIVLFAYWGSLFIFGRDTTYQNRTIYS